ncbi:MAG: histone deacetylase [Nanoarchaeota archaeon]|nr:histone deacetylase [Nanoarchaeota archaeon]
MKLIFDEKVLDYQGTLGFKQRLICAYEFLKHHHSFIKPEIKITEPLVHTRELIKKVKERNFFNPDSPAYENIYNYAILALNSAIKAQEIQGFSLLEPPGHHAGKNFLGGFCYFNNIAEAVKQSNLKTLIMDIDGHHGNGTQDIFENDPDVFYISLHRSPLYPGTGLNSKNNILNLPLPADCGERIYLETLQKAIKKAQGNFKFKQIAISAGFDTYQGDLASLNLTKDSYRKIGKIIKKLSQKTNSRVFAVLEGGYTTNLGELIHEFTSSISE